MLSKYQSSITVLFRITLNHTPWPTDATGFTTLTMMNYFLEVILR